MREKYFRNAIKWKNDVAYNNMRLQLVIVLHWKSANQLSETCTLTLICIQCAVERN